MATTCPVGFNIDKLRRLVRAEYDRVAREPEGRASPSREAIRKRRSMDSIWISRQWR
ncbi:MAG: hypothetical protein WD688_13850 [Candidatus Binatia bacterium]